MKQHLLAIIAVLAAINLALFSIETASNPHSSRSGRTYGYNPAPDTWSDVGDETPSVLQEDNTGSAAVPLTEVAATTGSIPTSPEAGDPLNTPPTLLATSAMAELTPVQLPPLDAGMVNVTGGFDGNAQTAGYRVNPRPGEFAIAVPYDPSLLPQGFTEDDIQTYVYDRQHHRWAAIQRDSVNEADLLVCSRFRPWEKGLPHTQNDLANPQDALVQVQDMMSFAPQGEGGGDSPLDFINAVLKTPEMPETSAYTPTSIKELKAADPLEGLTLMQPPMANNSGTANLSYPIEIPAGRQGMQPSLALTYSSGGGNGWLGVGWDISIPSITVETRWGVPRYDQDKESEVYVYEGEQLVTKDGNGSFRAMPHRTNQWTDRYELDQDSVEQFFPRRNEAFDSIVRHGGGPDSYWWTVTHRNGVTDYYGKYASDNGVNNDCVLRVGADNTSGAIGHWALAESVDPFGNSVKYFYDIEYNAGIVGSTVIGKQIYIDSIRYTDQRQSNSDEHGKYGVAFYRKSGRNDVIVAANRGFKEVTADVLCYMEVLYNTSVIRRYAFFTENKRESQFKTRLTDIVRVDSSSKIHSCMENIEAYGNDSTFQGTRTHFDYYDAPAANAVFGDPKTYTLAEDNVQSTFVSQGFNNQEGKATALGGTRGLSWSLGGTISVGVGVNVCMTTVSVGGNFDYSRSQSEGLLTLIDLDGDGLADKVFKNDQGVFYRKRLPSAADSVVFAGEAHLIAGVSSFLHETSSTTTWGAQASAGCSFSGGWPATNSTTSTYFADVNADGLPDLVTEDGVLFNTTRQGGLVTFKSFYTILAEQQVTDNDPITVNTSVPCGTFIFDGEASDSLACEVDWVLDTVITIKPCLPDSQVTVHVLIDSLLNTGMYRVTYGYPVVVDTIQYDPNCENPYMFRIYRKEVRCTPKPLDPDMDAVKVWVVQRDGDISLSSSFSLLEEVSESRRQSKQVDGVRYTIQHNSIPYIQNGVLFSDSVNVFHHNVVPKDYYDVITMDTLISVHEGDILFFRLQSQGSRCFDVASWDIDIHYTDGSGQYDQYGREIDHYSSSEDFTVSGRQFFQTYAEDDTVHVTVSIKEVENQSLGYGGHLVMRWSNSGDIDSLEYDLAQYAGSTISEHLCIRQYDSIQFFGRTDGETNWGAVEIRPHIESAFRTTTSTGNYIKDTLDYYPPVYIDYDNYKGKAEDTLEHRLFGPLYRGWGQFAYNNNDSNLTITDAIDISSLRLAPILVPTDPDDTTSIYQTPQIDASTTQGDATAALSAQGIYYPLSDSTRWVEMQPESRYWAWVGYGNINYIMRDMVTNTRLPDLISAPETSGIPEYDHPVPQGGEIAGGTAVPAKTVRKQNRSELRNFSMTAGVPVVPISTGGSESNGGNRILTDYMDLNGDRYPDFVGEVTVQYSMPWGGIGKVREISQQAQGVSNSSTISEGTTYGASYTMPTRGTSNNPKNSKISFDGQGNLGASLGSGSDVTDYSLMDVNGDGLPDMVDAGGKVALNVGYSFLPFERWGHSCVRKGESDNSGTSLGLGSFNIAQASISGGVGVNSSENVTKSMLMDFNGDGLPDQVSKVNNSISVRYNYGNGQWSPAETVSGIQNLSHGTSYSESANAGVTLGYTFFGVLKLTGGVQTSPYNQSFSKDKVQVTDINGDGYPDYVTSDSENSMTVRYNQSGKTNLLRKVTNFTGSTMEMDYALSPQCFEKPQRSWNLDTLVVSDPNSPISGNVSSSSFRYSGPNHNRAERMDYGYGTVTTRQYDTNGDTLYRYTVEEFNNVNFTKRGRKTRDCVYDAADKPYVEHIYDATVYDLADSVVSGDGCARVDVYVGTESDLTNWYEGHSTAQITSRVVRKFDRYRNVTQYIHYGDTTHHDEWFKAEIDYATGMQHNLVAMPVQIVVKDHGGNMLQKRTASYDPTGKLQQLVRISGGGDSQYDFTYDTYGNLSSALMPQDLNGQRLQFSYQYDNSVHTYPVRVDNVSLGFFSMASYDFKFGKPTKTEDINGNEMRYQYDFMGRNTVILAPYEIDAGRPYTIRMDYHPKNYGSLDITASGAQSYACTYHFDIQHQSDPIRTTLISDGLGRLLQTKKDAEINGSEWSLVTGKVVYDCFGRTVAQHHPFKEDTSLYAIYNPYYAPGTRTSTEYDILDRQTKVKLPTSDSTVMSYGVEAWSGKTLLRTVTTDAEGNEVKVLTGTMGQQLKQVAPYGTTTLFEYDCLGQLTKSTDPDGFETEYWYDEFGQLLHRHHPDAGDDWYEYDLAGNLTRHTNAAGEHLDYSYHYNQLTDVVSSLYPANNVHYEYGTYNSTNLTNNSVGKVTRQEDGSGWQAFSYGKLGEIVENIRTFALPFEEHPYTFKMQYEYDSYNRLQRMTYPDGEVVSYGYNRGGMLNSIVGVKNGVPYKYLDSIRYNRFELRDTVFYGNGTWTEYAYDTLQRLKTLKSHTSSGAGTSELMQDIVYDYDHVGNITEITNTTGMLANGLGNRYHSLYTYDDLYRLTGSNGWWGSESTAYQMQMSYHPNGRIERKYADAQVLTQTGTSNTLQAVDYDNRYHYNNSQPSTLSYIDVGSDQEFQWDAKGNMTKHINHTENRNRYLCWDEQNRLLGVVDEKHLSYYQYDANGERTLKLTGSPVAQNVSGQWHYSYPLNHPTLYASPYIVCNDKGYTKHYYAESERIASRIGGGGLSLLDMNVETELLSTHMVNSNQMCELVLECLDAEDLPNSSPLQHLYDWRDSVQPEKDCYWYHPDHLGSSSWITCSNGTAVQHLHYLPWGEDFVDQRLTSWAALYTFSAKERDSETGFSYFGSRYYNPDLSIWLSVDPMSDKYPSLSPYVYCADNPVKLVDPNGEEFIDSEGNRVRVRVLKDGSIHYKFSRKTSEATKSEFISNHNESISALAKTRSGKKCIRFLNNCYTSVSISPTDESGNQNSLVIPSCDENGNVELNDGVYESVVIKPFMGTIRSKARRDNVDVDEILGATLIVEAGHLRKNQISRDFNDNLTEESKYYQLYNQYVDYRYNYRKEMGQPVDGTVFNNSANINPRLNSLNSKRKKQYGEN